MGRQRAAHVARQVRARGWAGAQSVAPLVELLFVKRVAGGSCLHAVYGGIPGWSHAWARPDVLARRLNVRVHVPERCRSRVCNIFFLCRYDGEWCDGAKNGRGEMLFPNGQRQHGVWEQDVLVHVLVHVVNGKVVPVVTPISAMRK